MTAENTVKIAEALVIKKETEYVDGLLTEFDKSRNNWGKQDIIQNKVLRELERTNPKGKVDEEECIIGALVGFFRKKKK